MAARASGGRAPSSTAADPTAVVTTIGPNMIVLAVAATRPSSASGLCVCTAVTAATSAHGSPTPATTDAATTPGHQGRHRMRQLAANSTVPATPTAVGGYRASSRPTISPPTREPAPWALSRTPRTVAGRPSTSVTTAYPAAVVKPDMPMVTAASPTGTRIDAAPDRTANPARTPRGRCAAGGLRVSRSAA
ncbi:hypothetical protein Xph01_40070 [Micromonospora phaseoli]|nr:hypothetical protein Xph01_40070 [Micromonospora phaseoli]